MVDFSGWEMPVQYEGIIAEHRATREKAGLFDVSHMGEIRLTGTDSLKNLQHLLPNDLSKMSIGQATYSPLLYENGTVVDDLSCYKLGDEEYLLCVNCSNKDKDFAWIQKNLTGDCQAVDESDEFGQIALQGPMGAQILQEALGFDLKSIKYWWFTQLDWEGIPLMIARMGYTGEEGAEIFVPAEHTQKLWEHLMDQGELQGLQPIGLGARDTLRMEVAYPLYGQELDDRHVVLGANLNRFLKLNKEADFIGKEALLQAKEKGDYDRLVYLILEDKGIPRHDYPVVNEAGEKIGQVTSGNHSPSSSQAIAIAYVQPQYADSGDLFIEVRGKKLKTRRISPPFYQPKK